MGDPGIGKSALLDAAALAADGFTIVRLVGVQSESAFPYAGLLALVRPLQNDLSELPGSQGDPLRAVLAMELAGIEAFAVSAGLLALFAAVAERGPLLVLVDDVQWLDDPTRDALAFVLRRLGADSVAVVLAARPGGLSELARVVETIVDVAPLDDASALVLLEGAVASMSGTAQSAVLNGAHGNPLALLELPHRLSVEQREGREPLPPMLVAGALVESAFAQEAAGLSASSRIALALAALLEEDSIDVFETAAARLDVSLTDLEPAEVGGMITLSPGRMTFRHPLVRAAILGAVDHPTLRDVHRAIADVLPPGERRALHLAEATVGTDDEAAAELIAAAEAVPAVTGAALLTRAAELLADASERARVLGEAARRATLAGRLEQASSLVERGLALDPPDCVRGGLLVTSGRIAWMTRPPVEATARLLDGAALLESHDRPEAVSALRDAFHANLATGSIATSIVERILALADRSEPTERVLADLVSGISLVQLGRPDEGEQVLRGLLAEPVNVASSSVLADAGIIAALWLSDYPTALEEAGRTIERARSAGHVSRLPQLLQFQGFCEARSGHFAAAYAAVSEAVSLAEELGQVVLWSDAVNTLAGIEARLGLHDRCHEHAALAIDRCGALGLDWFRGHAMSTLALSEIALGRYEQAVLLVEEMHGMIRASGVRDPDEFSYELLVEALVLLGRNDEAAAAVTEVEGLFAAVGRSLDVLAVRCAALVAEDGRAPELFERAIALHPGYAPFELARTHLLYGERLRRMGQRRRAREELRAALELFQGLGADWWADRCRRELVASGARLRKLDATNRDELTPQELQVALQVARGLTNREIARTLFLSPKTVEFHLTRIYRKLDLNARSELVDRFAGQFQ